MSYNVRMTLLSERQLRGYVVAALSVAALTLVLKLLGGHVNATTVSLALLLNVLLIAIRWGSAPALVASILAMLCFNFFFLPPFATFNIAATDNWIALLAFLVTAVTAGQLSARAEKRAEEAEQGKREIGRLYAELREAFERASHAEALRQSEKLKSALLDAVTHDLRTPLTSIKASITTLLDEVRGVGESPVALDPESRREMMEIIDEESDRLSRFINGLIELARIEAGELQLRRRWGVVDEIISTALARAEPITRNHHVEVEVEKELPGVRVDERAVSEVVYTLVDNAAKYSAPGSRIRIRAQRADDDSIRMTVEDEGPGIAPDLRERVFDKFFRATSSHQSQGTGMGLAIAKGIVEAHGGRISIESGAEGKGTLVVFTLPIGDEDPDETPAYAVSTTANR
ncbi:MAG TPA: ATP-binding protein [Pyrinomonadaceae bacterium]|nr:ATP-binding protein [Pyrinomonadaceae bacterium]